MEHIKGRVFQCRLWLKVFLETCLLSWNPFEEQPQVHWRIFELEVNRNMMTGIEIGRLLWQWWLGRDWKLWSQIGKWRLLITSYKLEVLGRGLRNDVFIDELRWCLDWDFWRMIQKYNIDDKSMVQKCKKKQWRWLDIRRLKIMEEDWRYG